MPKKVRSARGEIVDFDLIKIKEQMAKQPEPLDVKRRQDFIDKRLRRRLNRKPNLKPQVLAKPEVNVEKEIAKSPPQNEKIDVKPTPSRPVKKTRQKARPKTGK